MLNLDPKLIEMAEQQSNDRCSKSSTVISTTNEGLQNDGGLLNPYCYGQEELSTAHELRARVAQVLRQQRTEANGNDHLSSEIHQIPAPLFTHFAHGLAYTIGSALGCTPPSFQECLDAFLVPNKAGLTAGARAWSKHSHRSAAEPDTEQRIDELALLSPGKHRIHGGHTPDTPLEPKNVRPLKQKKKKNLKPEEQGFWGVPSGPVPSINSRALALFHKICDPHNATWRNVHWLPHHVLVYEVRVNEGYGMRWSQDWGGRATGPWLDENGQVESGDGEGPKNEERLAKDSEYDERRPPPWTFRGFVEPMMENGHELKWRHPAQIDHFVSSK